METKDLTYQHPYLARIIAFLILFPAIFASLWAFFDPLDPFGIKFLEKVGIWGYIGLLALSFFISIIGIALLIKKPPRTLLKIETELRKDEDLEPQFFRRAGPSWIDFEKEYIFRREEIDEIIDKLDEEPRQVVEGGPASGKSVLLKHVGFDLKNSRYKVFYIDCRNEMEENIKTYLKEALHMDDAKTLIIIDDYHLEIDICDYFLRQYRNQGISETKVLIGTRPIDKKRHSEIHNLNKTQITPESASQNIIGKFLREHLNLNDEKIENFSMIFREYERDLWYLSWALMTFKPGEAGIKPNDIYGVIKNSIVQRKDCAEDIFLPLSILNRFEIPMEKRILTSKEYGLGIAKKKIDDLIEKNEIVEKTVMGSEERSALTLHHSSLAELIHQTYQNTELGEDFKDRFNTSGDSDFEKGFLLHYLIHSDLLYYVDTTSLEFQDVFMGTIMQNISDDGLREKIKRAVQHNADSNKELERIELHLYGYLTTLPTDFVAQLVKELNLDRLARRINETSDGTRISSLFGTTQGPFLKKMIKQIDLENLRSKVSKDIFALSGILGALANTDKDITRDFVRNKLGIPYIKKLFADLKDGPDFLARNYGMCYGMIAFADDTLTNELLRIIKDRLKGLPGEPLDEMPDSSNPRLVEIMNLIREAADEQNRFGRHDAVIDKLLDTVEETVIEEIHVAKRAFLDFSGGDVPESEALEEVRKGIEEELRGLFEDWNREFLERTLARFNITAH